MEISGHDKPESKIGAANLTPHVGYPYLLVTGCLGSKCSRKPTNVPNTHRL